MIFFTIVMTLCNNYETNLGKVSKSPVKESFRYGGSLFFKNIDLFIKVDLGNC